jgi:hypothetical protein
LSELVPFEFSSLVNTSDNEKVYRLEEALLDKPQVEIPLEEHFCNGMYARIVTIPEGVVGTGSISKDSHFIAMLSGDISIMTENGIIRIQAPYFSVSPAMVKRAGYAHKETVFLTVHRTDKTSPEDAEKDIFLSEDDQFNEWVNKCQGFIQQ